MSRIPSLIIPGPKTGLVNNRGVWSEMRKKTWRQEEQGSVDEPAYVRVECCFDRVNGPTLHQLSCRDCDTHKRGHTNAGIAQTHTHTLAQIKRKEGHCTAIHLVSGVRRPPHSVLLRLINESGVCGTCLTPSHSPDMGCPPHALFSPNKAGSQTMGPHSHFVCFDKIDLSRGNATSWFSNSRMNRPQSLF